MNKFEVAFDRIKKSVFPCDKWIQEDIEHYKAVVKALEIASLQKWIPVAERLPEIGQCVLGYTGSCCQIAKYEGGCSWWTNYHSHTVTGGKLFTHWMPLSQPPKEEK